MSTTLLSFTPLAADFTGSSRPSYGVRNRHRFLGFEDSADQVAYFTGIMPYGFGADDLSVVIQYMAESATSGDAVFEAAFERHNTSTDLDSDSFATSQFVVDTVPATAGITKQATIAFTSSQYDGLQASDQFRLLISVNGTDSSHTVTGDIQITSVTLVQSASIAGDAFFSFGAGQDSAIGQGTVAGSPPAANAVESIAHGYNTMVDAAASRSFAFGARTDIYGINSAAFGFRHSLYGAQGFAAGEQVTLNGANGVGFGYLHYAAPGASNAFMAGTTHNINASANATLFGANNSGYASQVLVAGTGSSVSSQNSFSFGNNCDIGTGSQNGASGLNNTIHNTSTRVFAFGSSNVLTGQDILAVGNDNHVPVSNNTYDAYSICVIGNNNDLGNESYGQVIVGDSNISGTGGYGVIIVGNGNGQQGVGYQQGDGVICVGRDNNLFFDSAPIGAIVIGRNNVSNNYGYGHITAGWTNTNRAQYASLVLGGNCSTGDDVSNVIAHGIYADARRENQRAFGTARATASLGHSQWSFIVEHVQTTDATQTTLITLDLEEDKGYAIRVLLIARNTTTNAEVASLILNQATAYRDTGGSAVLVSSPVSLTNENSGGNAASFAADLAQSGNNILLRVTGVAAQTVEWCAKLEFCEVVG